MAGPEQMGPNMGQILSQQQAAQGGGKGAMGIQNGFGINLSQVVNQGPKLNSHVSFLSINTGGLFGFDFNKSVAAGPLSFIGAKLGPLFSMKINPITPPSLPVAGMGSGASMSMGGE